MTRAVAMRIIQEHRAELKDMGVTSLSLFGSTARDEAGKDSDVDLLVEFDHSVGLLEFIGVQQHLEKILGVAKVDLVMRRSLRREIRDDVIREIVHAL